MSAKTKKPSKSASPGRAKSLSKRMDQVDSWREQFNPLVGLVIARARMMFEAAQRGEFADLQWTYKFVEERYPTLFALVERRTSTLLEMNWDIRSTPADKLPAGGTLEMADQQAAYLRECYDKIDNLTDAIEHLAMATFRGYAHVQKQDLDGDGCVDHFECLDSWNFVRAGLYGDWWWNPEAMPVNYRALPPENRIVKRGEEGAMSVDDFLIRVVKRPVNPIALLAFIREAMAVKDWSGFLEIFGIPGGVVIGPPNVPTDKESEFQLQGSRIAEGGTGYLPNGSDFKFNDSPRGNNPFKDFLRFGAENVVLAGTGGLLTMLTESGSGTLGGHAHADTFNKIGRSEAKKISELFNRQFDKQLLAEKFPDQPVMAYFQLASSEETSTKAIVEDALKLSQGGYQLDPADLSEKTGYTVTVRPPVTARTAGGNSGGAYDETMLNRDLGGVDAFRQAIAQDLEPVLNRLSAILNIRDDAILKNRLEAFLADFPAFKSDVLADPQSARVIRPILEKAFLEGATGGDEA